MPTKLPEVLIKTPREKAPKCCIEKLQEVDRPQNRALHLIDSCSTFAKNCGTSFFTTDWFSLPSIYGTRIQVLSNQQTLVPWSVHRPECRRLSCVTVWCFFNRFAQYGRFHEISFIDWNIILISLPSSWYENTVLTSFSVSKESVLFEMVFAKTSIRPLCCMLEFITIFMKRKHCLPINIFVFLWWDDFFLPFCRLWKSVFFETVFAKTGFSYDGPILLEFSMYHLEVGQCWEEYEKWDGYQLDSV